MPKVSAKCTACSGAHSVYLVPGETFTLTCPNTGSVFKASLPAPTPRSKKTQATRAKKTSAESKKQNPSKNAAGNLATRKSSKSTASRSRKSDSSAEAKIRTDLERKYPTAQKRVARIRKLEELIDLRRKRNDELSRQLMKAEKDVQRIEKLESRIGTQLSAFVLKETQRTESKREQLRDRLEKICRTQITVQRSLFKFKGQPREEVIEFQNVLASDRCDSKNMKLLAKLTEQSQTLLRQLDTVNEDLRFLQQLRSQAPNKLKADPRLPQGLIARILDRDQLEVEAVSSSITSKYKRDIEKAAAEIAQYEKELELIVSLGDPDLSDGSKPPQRLITQWQDAEELARDYLIWMGYSDARCSGEGSDGGIDVEGAEVVAQVKMHNKPTGRPDIQQLFGVAAAEGKRPVFFAMAYSAEAKQWATRVGMTLFQFKRDGSVRQVF